MIISIDTDKKLETIRKKNKELAKKALEEFFDKYKTDELKRTFGVTADPIDIETFAPYVQMLAEHIRKPTANVAYQPPLPPSVQPPPVASITAHITREPGWNNALGYKIELILSDDTYSPNNIALAIYNSPDCESYKFTTGAFQYDSERNIYFSVCPAGFEPGDADVHMGLLYGSAPLSCWTLPAGTMETEILVYG